MVDIKIFLTRTERLVFVSGGYKIKTRDEVVVALTISKQSALTLATISFEHITFCSPYEVNIKMLSIVPLKLFYSRKSR